MPAKGDYPIINFHFLVEWGENFRIGFSEVSGQFGNICYRIPRGKLKNL